MYKFIQRQLIVIRLLEWEREPWPQCLPQRYSEHFNDSSQYFLTQSNLACQFILIFIANIFFWKAFPWCILIFATSSNNHDDCRYLSFHRFLIYVEFQINLTNLISFLRLLLVLTRKFSSVVIDAVEIMLARYDFKLSNRWILILNEKFSPIWYQIFRSKKIDQINFNCFSWKKIEQMNSKYFMF